MTAEHFSPIVEKAAEFVTARYNEKVPGWALYHNLTHTLEVVEATREIGEGMKLSADDMEVVLLAAWFHDLGYAEGAEGHEERSARRAEEFLRKEKYPEARLSAVLSCIRATVIPQRPETVLQEVLCDADVSHLGKRRFKAHSDLLRMEWELRTDTSFSDVEWLKKNIEFATRCGFHTKFARKEYGARRSRNLARLQARLRKAEQREQRTETKEAAVPDSQKKKKLKRVDGRASLMVAVSAVFLALMGVLLVSRVGAVPSFAVPGFGGVVVFLGALVYAVLGSRAEDAVVQRRYVRISQNLFLFGAAAVAGLFAAAYAGIVQ